MSKTEFVATLIGWIAGGISSDIGKFLLGAVGALGIAWVNTRLGIWRDERADKRRREGATAYSVALIESTLRRYVRDCMAVMNDDGEPDTPQGDYEDWKASIPEPSLAYPDKIDWTLFEPQTMYQALAIPNIELSIKKSVSWAYDQASPPDRHGFIEERQRKFAQLAIFSARAQANFHRHHPAPYTSDQDDVIEEISKKMIALDKAEQKQKKENAMWMAAFERHGEERAAQNSDDVGAPAARPTGGSSDT
ncbi:hypothetical protein AB4Z52_13630 [Rhizobium sp. 2YAF20]|uniref:hypothetical protein n=1 Tax=Rhizobium sp. 2YAF20 TaxID=3233027 RepID=UPI003F958BC5